MGLKKEQKYGMRIACSSMPGRLELKHSKVVVLSWGS